MNEEAINYVMRRMSTCLDNGQMIRLQKALEESLCNEEGVTEISSAELFDLTRDRFMHEGKDKYGREIYRLAKDCFNHYFSGYCYFGSN